MPPFIEVFIESITTVVAFDMLSTRSIRLLPFRPFAFARFTRVLHQETHQGIPLAIIVPPTKKKSDQHLEPNCNELLTEILSPSFEGSNSLKVTYFNNQSYLANEAAMGVFKKARTAFSKSQSRVTKLEKSVEKLKKETLGLEEKTRGLKQETRGLKQETRGLKHDIRHLQKMPSYLSASELMKFRNKFRHHYYRLESKHLPEPIKNAVDFSQLRQKRNSLAHKVDLEDTLRYIKDPQTQSQFHAFKTDLEFVFKVVFGMSSKASASLLQLEKDKGLEPRVARLLNLHAQIRMNLIDAPEFYSLVKGYIRKLHSGDQIQSADVVSAADKANEIGIEIIGAVWKTAKETKGDKKGKYDQEGEKKLRDDRWKGLFKKVREEGLVNEDETGTLGEKA
ncbi:hypothetical protein BJ875DRAFT_527375 [Amylocarpus encephaloides]|uniref:Uncharacterized protein n=1 Tax=Amylocarpus encephaloides TaxID=45428 RepID=A0A9P7Y734_9HELO|nr:hypothetical protein BJ875DRAFT_527375 [Amylocarpus encephaloides]